MEITVYLVALSHSSSDISRAIQSTIKNYLEKLAERGVLTEEKAATETAEKGEWFPEDSLHGKIYDRGKSIPKADSINAPRK